MIRITRTITAALAVVAITANATCSGNQVVEYVPPAALDAPVRIEPA
mgnify:CR=1 FL=1